MLVEAGKSIVKRNPNCNHFLSKGRLRIARLWELRYRSTALKLALQHEKDQIAKEREDSRRTIAYLHELLHKKLIGDIDVLLAGNHRVPITEPTLSTPAPLL